MLGWAKSHQFQDQNYKNNYNNCHLLSINGVLSALLRIYLCYFISSQRICAAGCARLSIVYLASSPPVVKCLLYRRREAETYISQNALPQMVPDQRQSRRCSWEIWKVVKKVRSLFSESSFRQTHRHEVWCTYTMNFLRLTCIIPVA